MKPKWKRKPCGCVKTRLSIGPVMIRCRRHRGKPSKRLLAFFDEDGIVRLELGNAAAVLHVRSDPKGSCA